MAIYDIEQFLRDIETLFKAKLNTEIGIINTEKGDFTISNIVTDAYYNGQLPQNWSYPKFVVYGVSAIAPLEMHQENMLRRVQAFLEVVIPDEGNVDSQAVNWHLLRYMRACAQVVHKNARDQRIGQGYAKVKVTELTPQTFGIENKVFRSAGVAIEGVWAEN